MINEDIYANFKRGIKANLNDSDEDLIIVFSSGSILLRQEDLSIPTREELGCLELGELKFLGDMDNKNYYYGEFNGELEDYISTEFKNLKSIIGVLPRETFLILAMAYQIFTWEKKNKYCGICGHQLSDKETERAKICNSCGNVIYPRISPAMIISVVKDDKILLANNKNFPREMYGLVSGFVDAGENIEACINRELYEEVGIKVKNIKYYGSQVWPFPDSLMIGFTAEYESGEIRVDQSELTDAGWFSKDNMPEIPKKNTIANKIINDFLGLQ